MYTTIISSEELRKHLYSPNWRIFDCRFSLADPNQGRRDYDQVHIPGAQYADLDKDLCGPILTRPDGFTELGRHPLPDVGAFVDTLNRWGVTNKSQVVAYDDKGGGLAAARLWWMLRWVGHDAVAVLDGGWQGWVGQQYPVSADKVARKLKKDEKPFEPQVREKLLATTEDVLAVINNPDYLIIDSRAPERYRGDSEPIDPVAGRIPGAVNAPYGEMQTSDEFFHPNHILKVKFEQLLGRVFQHNAIFYCGSGVTAAANLLAMKHAGIGDGKLYAGSWSEWIADLSRPIELG
jgi:thiosulfate/3-mercaptopyruvate sulfurtransferase